jgi:hypothetical protein
MKRRNLLTVLGTAAAGSTAVMGTGAFSSVSANRTLNVEVADDANAFLALTAPNSLANGEYATGPTEGEADTLRLNFDDEADVAGEGLNDDAVTRIESVFRVENRGTSYARIGIDKRGLSYPDRWDFISGIGGGSDPYGTWDEHENVGPGITPGDSLTVGVQVDTRGEYDSLGGSIVVQAESR